MITFIRFWYLGMLKTLVLDTFPSEHVMKLTCFCIFLFRRVGIARSKYFFKKDIFGGCWGDFLEVVRGQENQRHVEEKTKKTQEHTRSTYSIVWNKKSLIFDQIFGIGFFLGRASVDFCGILGVVFGGFSEAF